MKIDPLEWHRKKMAGEAAATTTTPECGWFLRPVGKVGKETKYLPASIYWEPRVNDDGERVNDDILRCEVGGAQVDPEEEWLFIAKRPISKDEYDMRTVALFTDTENENAL